MDPIPSTLRSMDSCAEMDLYVRVGFRLIPEDEGTEVENAG